MLSREGAVAPVWSYRRGANARCAVLRRSLLGRRYEPCVVAGGVAVVAVVVVVAVVAVARSGWCEDGLVPGMHEARA